MKPKERTTISQLTTGDRFYQLGDAVQQVWQIVAPRFGRASLREKYAKRDKDVRSTPFKNNVKVVFLRHSDSPKSLPNE